MDSQGRFLSDCSGKYVMTAWIHNLYNKHNAKQKVGTELIHNRLYLSTWHFSLVTGNAG